MPWPSFIRRKADDASSAGGSQSEDSVAPSATTEGAPSDPPSPVPRSSASRVAANDPSTPVDPADPVAGSTKPVVAATEPITGDPSSPADRADEPAEDPAAAGGS